MKWRLWLGVLAVTGGLIGCGAPSATKTTGVAADQQSTAPVGTAIGDHAPSFDLTTLKTGKSITLSSVLGHKYVLLNAWASWCPPCNQEAPEVAKITKKYASRLNVVGINLTSTDGNMANVRAFVKKYHLTMPIGLDKKAKFADAYHIMALPTSYILSPQGKVLAVHQGPITAQWVQSAIDA